MEKTKDYKLNWDKAKTMKAMFEIRLNNLFGLLDSKPVLYSFIINKDARKNLSQVLTDYYNDKKKELDVYIETFKYLNIDISNNIVKQFLCDVKLNSWDFRSKDGKKFLAVFNFINGSRKYLDVNKNNGYSDNENLEYYIAMDGSGYLENNNFFRLRFIRNQ